jgi:hypothetical protein
MDSGIPDAMPTDVGISISKPSFTKQKSKAANIRITSSNESIPVSDLPDSIKNMVPGALSQTAPKTISQSEIIIDNNKEIINIDVDFIVKQIQDVLRSPSPFTLYKKSTELKENFAAFINYLVKKIAFGFNSQNKTVIMSMYNNA